jgi:hypothetical protein
MNIAEIESVFGTAKYPELGFPLEERPSEWEYVYDQLRGKDWHDLAVEDLDAQGGLNEAICCLSVDVFVYFLPGLINLALNDPETISTRYGIVDGIVSRLTRSDQATGRGQLLKRRQKQFDRARARHLQKRLAVEGTIFVLLSSEQRQFLIKFLRYAMQQEPTLCPVLVNSAIRNLERGEIAAYVHEDILQWAAQFKSARRVARNE